MTDKPARQTRTPEQRAALALATEQRKVDRLTAKVEEIKATRVKAMQKSQADLEALQPELTAAERRRDHLAKSPDLDDVAAHAKTTTAVSSVGSADKGQVLMNEADSG